MEITFSLDATKVTKKITSMIEGFSDFSKPFNRVGEDLLHFFGIEVFQTQGAVLGENWRKLAASTLALRAARSGYYRQTPITTEKILIWTGRLKSGFKKEVKPLQLRIYNDVDYFKYHQRAGGRPPQRRMLAINERVIGTVVDKLNQYSEEVVKA